MIRLIGLALHRVLGRIYGRPEPLSLSAMFWGFVGCVLVILAIFGGAHTVVVLELAAGITTSAGYLRNRRTLRSRKFRRRTTHLHTTRELRGNHALAAANRCLLLAATVAAAGVYMARVHPGREAMVCAVVVSIAWVVAIASNSDPRRRNTACAAARVDVAGPSMTTGTAVHADGVTGAHANGTSSAGTTSTAVVPAALVPTASQTTRVDYESQTWFEQTATNLLDGLSIPIDWFFPRRSRFTNVFYAAVVTLLASSIGFLEPGWTDVPRTVGSAGKLVVQKKWNELVDDKANGSDEPTANPASTTGSTSGPTTGPPTTQPPSQCADAASRSALTDRGLRRDLVERVLTARNRFYWPTIGCDVARVVERGRSTLISYSGGEGDGVIVDDGAEANAAITYAAAELASRELTGSGSLTSLSPSARAATGRWHLEGHGQDCNLLEVPDNANGQAFTLTSPETAAYFNHAAPLGAFPMLSPTSTPQAHVVQYLVPDSASPTGYRSAQTITYRADERSQFPKTNLPTCKRILRDLTTAGTAVEAAARNG
jgi:hypothetical protein